MCYNIIVPREMAMTERTTGGAVNIPPMSIKKTMLMALDDRAFIC
jgi:hypothetical protein